MESSSEAGDINRHYYSLQEGKAALEQPVVQRLLKLMRLRSTHPAFQGEFALHYSNDSSVATSWKSGKAYCAVMVDLNFNTTTITFTGPEGEEICQRW